MINKQKRLMLFLVGAALFGLGGGILLAHTMNAANNAILAHSMAGALQQGIHCRRDSLCSELPK